MYAIPRVTSNNTVEGSSGIASRYPCAKHGINEESQGNAALLLVDKVYMVYM